MKLIVGLGNPGKEYENTRHNAGYRFIDAYAKANDLTFDKHKFQGSYTEFNYQGKKVILLKPEKYMNLSGEVIKDYIQYFKIDIKDLLVIYDDLDTAPGCLKLRYKGSSGGHNGIKNIENHLHTNEYNRIKIGIAGSNKQNPIDYVIGKISKEDLDKINSVNSLAPNIINDYLNMTFDNLMNKYNGN